MLIGDLTVEVRDKNLVRKGQILPSELDIKLEPAFNNVGTWRLTLPAEHPMADVLRTPGAGIIVTHFRGGTPGAAGAYGSGAYGSGDYGFGEIETKVLMSGPVDSPEFQTTPEDTTGTITFTGISDDHVIADYLAWPQPSNSNPTTQTLSHDVRTGPAETLLHQYVNANLGPGAPTGRKITTLTMGANGARGPALTRKARFDNLGELLRDIALVGNLGFRVVQRGSGLVFETYEVQDLSSEIRLDIRNGQLAGQRVSISAPKATRVIVAGQEEGVNRQFVAVTTSTSLAAEAEWGRRIEVFKDQRNTNVTAELTQAGEEILAEDGFTKVSVQAVPVEDSTMQFLYEWDLGDKVGVVVEDQELQAIATGVVLVANSGGVKLGVVIGDPTGFSRELTFAKKVNSVESRVAMLERNAEVTTYAVTEDPVSGDVALPADVTVAGDQSVSGNLAVSGGLTVAGKALPFAFAAGQAVTPAGGSIAVTFPSGRFSQPPIVTLAVVSGSMPGSVAQAYHSVPTATGMTIYTHSTAAVAGGALTVQWIAVQMTSSSGAG